ncbi:MAG TPA: ATP-binding protein [Thermoleophilaceae bacterium]|jgi:anti-sigma regulatory factor (Ser/Thr protein kinase)
MSIQAETTNGAVNGNRRFGRRLATIREPRSGRGMRVELDWGPTAAAEARTALGVLDGRMDRDVLDDVRLLVSELVTNSVRHSEGDPARGVALEVALDERTVHVEVLDGGDGFAPQPREDDDDRIGGWGLQLVDRIAHRWGVARNGFTRVWFEIDESAAS